jgi:hypothetical protein
MLLHFNLGVHALVSEDMAQGSRISLLGFHRKDEHPTPYLATDCTPTCKTQQYQIIVDESMKSSKVWVGRSARRARGGRRQASSALG